MKTVRRGGGRGVSRVSATALIVINLSCASSPGSQSAPDGGAGDDGSSLADTGTADSSATDSALSCEAGASVCKGTCVDVSTDINNCGGCGNTCHAGDQCSDGQCCVVPLGKGVCTVLPACGCTPTQNCSRDNDEPETCVPSGGISLGQDCVSDSDCQHGLVCNDGVCMPPCLKLSDCPTNAVCFEVDYTSSNGDSVYLGYNACTFHCDPVFPTVTDANHHGCSTQQQCLLENPGVTFCENSSGTLLQDSPCTYSTDCAPGYTCLSPNNTCEQLCRVGFSDCTSGTCTAFTTPAYDTNGAYNQEIGFCP
jgi:Stigma-specific protein, Stig1